MAILRTHILRHVLTAAQHDERIVGLVDYGSSSEGRDDAYSDLDLALFIRDSDFVTFENEWKAWATPFGPLLLAYVGGIGHPWAVYDALPLPLRVDFAFHRASAVDVVLGWPNAPLSVQAMVLYDATAGALSSNIRQLVGQSSRPADPHLLFERLCGDFWYYWLRSWTRLLRGELWSARYDFNFIVLGNLIGLLRLEADAVDRWHNTSVATEVEQMLASHRRAQLDACVPGRGEAGLRRAFGKVAQLGYDVSTVLAAAHGWPWPQPLADRIAAIAKESHAKPRAVGCRGI